MQEKVKISEVDKTRKTIRKNKFLLKRLQMFYIFWTNVSEWIYIKYWDVKRTFMYLLLFEDSTISSIMQA